MKENWIEDVLVDLSKSAYNEGRFELFHTLRSAVGVASKGRVVASNPIGCNIERPSHSQKTAVIIDIYEYRHRKLEKQFP